MPMCDWDPSDYSFDVSCDEEGNVEVTVEVSLRGEMLAGLDLPEPDAYDLARWYVKEDEEDSEPDDLSLFLEHCEYEWYLAWDEFRDRWIDHCDVKYWVPDEVKRDWLASYFDSDDILKHCQIFHLLDEEQHRRYLYLEGSTVLIQTRWDLARPQGWFATQTRGIGAAPAAGERDVFHRVVNLRDLAPEGSEVPALSPNYDPPELQLELEWAEDAFNDRFRRFVSLLRWCEENEKVRSDYWKKVGPVKVNCGWYEGVYNGHTLLDRRFVCRVPREKVVQAFLGWEPEDPALRRSDVRPVSDRISEVGYCGDEYEEARSLFEWVLQLENEALQQSIREQLRLLSEEDRESFRDQYRKFQHLLEDE